MKERQSGMELLRIVSMLMVLGVHIDGASLGLPDPEGDWGALSARDVWQLAFESLCIIGVNCFTLISGYFGIRLSARGVVALLFECVFYSVGLYTLGMIVKPSACTLTGWFESWLVLSHTDLWYVPAYFGLMLLSPFINAGLDRLTPRATAWIVGAIVAFNVWSGWVWQGSFNPSGYTVMQLVMVYIIGSCIRRYADVAMLRRRRGAVAVAYLASVGAVFVSAVYASRAFAYNSPFVLLESVLFFVLFVPMTFHSRTVNRLAGGAFAVYLIHKTPLVWGGVMKPGVAALWHNTSLGVFALSAVLLALGIYVAAAAVDVLRQALSGRILKRFL
ncbi:MAG: acyltransferase [Muribaculaceae bacterium]|nr:acyltransferase [Muribaculaceae bacterium]